MTPIASGTTFDRILRTCALAALLIVFGGWFLYDGYVAWPAENLEKAVQALDPAPQTPPAMNDIVTPAAGRDLLEEFEKKQGTAERLTRSDIERRLGAPGWESTEGARTELQYFGRAGVLKIELRGDLVAGGGFIDGYHNQKELTNQLIFGYALVPVAVIMLVQLVRVLTTRVVLSDEGLKVRGRPLIPFDAMTGLDAGAYRTKGFVDLVYQYQGDQRRVRLDPYVIREFAPIVTEICTRRGFENPLKPGLAEGGPKENGSAST